MYVPSNFRSQNNMEGLCTRLRVGAVLVHYVDYYITLASLHMRNKEVSMENPPLFKNEH